MRKPVVDGLAMAAVEVTTKAGRLLAGLAHAADARLAPVHAKLGKCIATMASATGELAIATDAFSKDGAAAADDDDDDDGDDDDDDEDGHYHDDDDGDDDDDADGDGDDDDDGDDVDRSPFLGIPVGIYLGISLGFP